MEPDSSLNGSDDDAEAFCDASERAAITSHLLAAFVGALSVLIACGNALVIVSVMYFKQLHTPTNYLILSLAAADLLVGVVVLPFSAALSVGSSCRPLSGLLCKIRGAFDVSLCSCSILNLCFISADRYFIVFRPLAYGTKMTPHVTGLMILASWALPILFAAITSVPGQNVGASDSRCNMFQSSQIAVFGVIFTSFIPAIVIFSLYMKILTVAHRQARSIQNAAKRGASVSRTESKATKTLAIVVGIYLCCWTPFFLSVSLYPLTGDSSSVPVIEAFKWLGWSNSMFNPFVYGLFYKWFRSAFRLILCGKIFQSDCSNAKLS